MRSVEEPIVRERVHNALITLRDLKLCRWYTQSHYEFLNDKIVKLEFSLLALLNFGKRKTSIWLQFCDLEQAISTNERDPGFITSSNKKVLYEEI